MSNSHHEVSESTLRRIQKLLAIASDARGDANECATAAAMAAKLMAKYNLEQADVLSATIQNGKAVFVSRQASFGKKKFAQKIPQGFGGLAFRIAKLCDCEARYGWDVAAKSRCVEFFGTENDSQIAAWLLDFCMNQLRIAMARYQNCGISRTRSESDSFRLAFLLAVSESLRQLDEARRREVAASTSGALVVLKSEAIRKQFGDFQYGKAKDVNFRDEAAAARGYAEGRKVDVNTRGVGGAAPRPQIN